MISFICMAPFIREMQLKCSWLSVCFKDELSFLCHPQVSPFLLALTGNSRELQLD